MPVHDAKSLAPLALVLLLTLPAVEVSGQPPAEGYTPPLTAWGHPDLQGVWNNNTNVPLERPDEFAGRETLTDEEVAARRRNLIVATWGTAERRVDVGGTGFYDHLWNEYGIDGNTSSLIVEPADGRLPPLTPAGEHDRATGAPPVQRAPTSLGDLTVYERCITRGLPGAMLPGFYNHNYHIVQTPEYVAIAVEMIHDARIVPLDGRPHLPPDIRQWLGDSRGHWDGDTLVVETTHFPDWVSQRGLVRPYDFHLQGADLRLVERFTRVNEDTIDYRITVEEPRTYTDSWTAAIPLNRFGGTLFEYACHEGNYALPNMLAGARAREAAGVR